MSPVRPLRSARQQSCEELLPRAAADRRLRALQAKLAAGPADRVAQVYERTVICTPGQGQLPRQEPAGQQRRATAQHGWRDADDSRRNAVLLVAGDKAGKWDAWYREAIPLAEQRYEDYLKQEDIR
jgi:hypothetical protein